MGGGGESQLPFGSVPFRHRIQELLQARYVAVSITFRLSALSAHTLKVKVRDRPDRLNYLSAQCPFGTVIRKMDFEDRHPIIASQLPFGSVPFRHLCNWVRDFKGTGWDSLNYLSAQCPFGTRARLHGLRSRGTSVSQLPFGSVPFRHRRESQCSHRSPGSLNYLSAQCPFGTTYRVSCQNYARLSLNYLSAQCPFGTSSEWRRKTAAAPVSITFRLSALSAHNFRRRQRARTPRSQLPFGSVPFRHTAAYDSWEDLWDTSQLPFGSVPFRHFRVGLNAVKGSVDDLSQLPFGSVPFRHLCQGVLRLTVLRTLVSITFRLSALSAPKVWKDERKAAKAVQSQLPFGSVPFRHHSRKGQRKNRRSFGCLNYLSAQCPFGTSIPSSSTTARVTLVSITFRLSALSARTGSSACRT